MARIPFDVVKNGDRYQVIYYDGRGGGPTHVGDYAWGDLDDVRRQVELHHHPDQVVWLEVLPHQPDEVVLTGEVIEE